MAAEVSVPAANGYPAAEQQSPPEAKQADENVLGSPIAPGKTVNGVPVVPSFIKAAPPAPAFTDEEMKPWLEAARTFKLNTDFELTTIPEEARTHLKLLVALMKKESDGKHTIQAMCDKIFLSKMLSNLRIPQMPVMLSFHNGVLSMKDLVNFFDTCLTGPRALETVVKPTHLSNGMGCISFQTAHPTQREGVTAAIDRHFKHFIHQRAHESESAALQSLMPGFIAQPRYECVISFDAPIEIRCVALWGRVHIASWWFGPINSQRNTWFVRRPVRRGELSKDDVWQIVHEHKEHNLGFERAVGLLHKELPAMAATSEFLASALGTPFLRADFFVGDPRWGTRLNEVAYGDGADYRSRREGDGSDGPLFDEGVNMARILTEGLSQCNERLPPSYFLTKFGVQGDSYKDMSVDVLPEDARLEYPPLALKEDVDYDFSELATPPPLCMTHRDMPLPLSDDALQPWLKAAADFEMNADFQLAGLEQIGRQLPLLGLYGMMRLQGVGKRTVMAIGDKFTSTCITDKMMIDGAAVPRMPNLLVVRGLPLPKEDFEGFIDGTMSAPDAYEVVMKPSHLAGNLGLSKLSPVTPETREKDIEMFGAYQTQIEALGVHPKMLPHLRDLNPGILLQPRYASQPGVEFPLELRLLTLWGKARVGVVLWNFKQLHHNIWFIRCPPKGAAVLTLGPNDVWKQFHENPEGDDNLKQSIEALENNLHKTVAIAELVSTSIGCPMLRNDFFVGDEGFGLVLNRVSYASEALYIHDRDPTMKTDLVEGKFDRLDDGPAIAQIFQAGMGKCNKIMPSEHFFAPLGLRITESNEVESI